MSKTVFVVFHKTAETGLDSPIIVRRTFAKATQEAAQIKPAVILELPTASGETKVLNRWELS